MKVLERENPGKFPIHHPGGKRLYGETIKFGGKELCLEISQKKCITANRKTNLQVLSTMNST